MKWNAKYVKLTLKDIEDPWYIREKNERYGLGNIWGIVKEIEPGRWGVVYSGHKRLTNSSPMPLDIQSGNIPNIRYFDYEELTEEEAFLYIL